MRLTQESNNRKFLLKLNIIKEVLSVHHWPFITLGPYSVVPNHSNIRLSWNFIFSFLNSNKALCMPWHIRSTSTNCKWLVVCWSEKFLKIEVGINTPPLPRPSALRLSLNLDCKDSGIYLNFTGLAKSLKIAAWSMASLRKGLASPIAPCAATGHY